jgi:hypothetical protein
MPAARRHLPAGIALLIGLGLGWALGGSNAPRLLAGGGDRWGDSIVVSGPVGIKYSHQTQTAIAQEAVYFLNYSKGLLLATVPMPQQVGTNTQVLHEFAERDLVKDFELPAGSSPHFLMTAGTMGATTDGAAPLFVFETTTGQVAAYRVSPVFSGRTFKPTFELLEKKADPRLARGTPPTR